MPGGLAVVTRRCVLLGKSSNCSARRTSLSARRQPQLTFPPCFKAMPVTTCSVLHEQRTRHRKRRLPLGVICTPTGPSTVRRRNCIPVKSVGPGRPMSSPSSDPTRAIIRDRHPFVSRQAPQLANVSVPTTTRRILSEASNCSGIRHFSLVEVTESSPRAIQMRRWRAR